MYILPPVHELSVTGIFDAGVPNRERIVLRPTQAVNLAAFALSLCVSQQEGVTPIPDQFFWLGERWVTPPAWIVVFTGPGSFQVSPHQTTNEPVFELHWGRSNTIFGQTGLSVGLFRLGGLSSYATPSAAPVNPNPMLQNPFNKY